MAYTQQQRRDHIRELQRMLYELSFFENRIPFIIPDGIYGRETAQAVKAFQQIYGLRPSGEVNHATWEMIAAEHLDKIGRVPVRLDLFPKDRKNISKGDRGIAVYAIQALLTAVAERFDSLTPPMVTGFYDEATETAVSEFQSIGLRPVTGQTDRETWNLLAAAVNS